MPELAEVKIMSEFINHFAKKVEFNQVEVSSAVKSRLNYSLNSNIKRFNISAQSRGKELLLTFLSQAEVCDLLSVTMGMSGNWALTPIEELPKHSHLIFKSDKIALCLVDPRRFAKWKRSSWSPHRGPCPLTQFENFEKNILTNLHKAAFRHPIHLVLMDQRYFNGIGNYLRAEILFRAVQDPFETAREALSKNPKILELCFQVPKEAYLIGGGQLRDWKNPFSIPAGGFESWLQCYGKSDSKIIDKNGRTFWYSSNLLKNES